MNAKEMESKLKDQQAAIEGLQASIKAVIEGRDKAHAEIMGRIDGLADAMSTMGRAMHDDQTARNEAFEGLSQTLAALHETVDDHTAKIEGRNKSAPTKRNMTDADAKAVLNGDYKELGHKEAAEKIGLTYAQVYSCRLEFTFKHVHKELRDAGWKNTFVK